MTNKVFRSKAISLAISCLFSVSLLGSDMSRAFAAVSELPAPNVMLSATAKTTAYPVMIGVRLDPANPLNLEFVFDAQSNDDISEAEASEAIGYFLAALTVPQKDLWVNLSPYEKDRIAADTLSATDMGETMLEQDYILKQLSSSLTNPESDLGKEYWKQAASSDTYNKIWIVPNEAEVYENGTSAFISKASLSVMTDADHLASQQNATAANSSAAVKSTILPAIEKEVNEGANFIKLRQVYHAIVMGLWFKAKFADTAFKHYFDHGKTAGIDINDPEAKEKVFQLYAEAFKKGVYNTTQKVIDPSTNRKVKRTFFSGGADLGVKNEKPLVIGVTKDGSSCSAVNPVSVKTKGDGTILAPIRKTEVNGWLSHISHGVPHYKPTVAQMIAAQPKIDWSKVDQATLDRLDVLAEQITRLNISISQAAHDKISVAKWEKDRNEATREESKIIAKLTVQYPAKAGSAVSVDEMKYALDVNDVEKFYDLFSEYVKEKTPKGDFSILIGLLGALEPQNKNYMIFGLMSKAQEKVLVDLGKFPADDLLPLMNASHDFAEIWATMNEADQIKPVSFDAQNEEVLARMLPIATRMDVMLGDTASNLRKAALDAVIKHEENLAKIASIDEELAAVSAERKELADKVRDGRDTVTFFKKGTAMQHRIDELMGRRADLIAKSSSATLLRNYRNDIQIRKDEDLIDPADIAAIKAERVQQPINVISAESHETADDVIDGGIDLNKMQVKTAASSVLVEFKNIDMSKITGLKFAIISKEKLTQDQFAKRLAMK